MGVYIIAEAGVNHNGSLELAKELVNVAAKAGADAVKFQTFNPSELAVGNAPKADYQKRSTGEGSQLAMLEKLALTHEQHHILREHCEQCGIDFMSSPFDMASADFLIDDMALPLIKIPSGELMTAPLLLKIAQAKKPVVLSTGMSTLADIEEALGVLAFGYLGKNGQPSQHAFRDAYQEGQQLLEQYVVLLHCTSAYPAAFETVNLRAMDTLGQHFNLPVGYSDHTPGITIPIAAAARGATVIEKHFTLDKEMEGPDHQASLSPDELLAMVTAVREVELSLGSSEKCLAAGESTMQQIARKSLVTTQPLSPGDVLSEDNMGLKRPGSGLSGMRYWEMLGKVVSKAYEVGELIDE